MGTPRYSCMQERLFANSVVFDGGYETECWMWIGSLTPDRYGKLSVRMFGRHMKLYAHRVSYELFIGPIPSASRSTTSVRTLGASTRITFKQSQRPRTSR